MHVGGPMGCTKPTTLGANQSLLFLLNAAFLAKKQQIPILLSLTIQHIIINVNYFYDIYVLFVGFEECAKDYECSKKCARAYMKRYGGWK
jgi:hypothetical protein